jgi:hypothetical protein
MNRWESPPSDDRAWESPGGGEPSSPSGQRRMTTIAPSEFEVPTRANIAESQRRAQESAKKQPARERDFVGSAQEFAGNILPIARTAPKTRQGLAELLGPSIEAVSTAGGAAAGTALGPAGIVGGGGLGYGIGRELTRRLAGAPTTTAPELLKDVGVGAAFEAGGRGVIAPAVEKTARFVGSLPGRLSDILGGKSGQIKAGKIAREAITQGIEDPAAREAALNQARKILSQAADDLSAAQVFATIDQATGKPVMNAPTLQALLQRASSRDPRFFTNLLGEQEGARLYRLQQIAGGANQTEARAAREEMNRLLNERLIPILEKEIGAANIAGKLAPKFESEAARFGQAAADKVEDVRRFSAAGERAAGTQVFPVAGQPRAPQRYTYMGELAERADEVAAQAAEASMRFGDAARFAQAANASLAAHGLRPLRPESIIQSLQARLSDPKVAPGNRDLQVSLRQIGTELQRWTDSNGVIDAWAIDSIRKNAVNGVVQRLYPNADVATQKRVAANIIEQVRPILIDAVEQAGGTGYREYLKNYALGSQVIGQTKVGAEAMRLYASSPEDFVRLVEGNDPKMIEKIFGSGSYNIFKEMSASTQRTLKSVADEVKRTKAIEDQASAGEKALKELLVDQLSIMRIPAYLNVLASTTNRALAYVESMIGKSTMNALTKGAKSARSFEELLNALPASERSRVLQVLNDSRFWEGFRSTAGGTLAGLDFESPRPPAVGQLGGITDMSFPLSESVLPR